MPKPLAIQNAKYSSCRPDNTILTRLSKVLLMFISAQLLLHIRAGSHALLIISACSMNTVLECSIDTTARTHFS